MRYLWIVIVLMLTLPAAAVEQVVVVGLFKGRAVLEIDGNRRVLAVGEQSPEGVKLLAADSEGAVLEIEGERRRMTLGQQISNSYTAPRRAEVQVWPDRDGMYRKTGSINGQLVDFLIDTGASHIAMNAAQARRLGIDYRVRGERGLASTASDVVPVYQVTLDSVRLGDVTQRNVTAVIFEGAQPEDVLLGMSFLGRVELRRESRMMVIREKY